MSTTWSKRPVEWTEDQTAFVSVPFTWLLPKAYQRCVWLKAQGYHVRAGGPAVSLMPDYLKDVAQIGGEVNALPRHNPEACRTTLGCDGGCTFCAVRVTEGAFRELSAWDPKRIVCDNDLLASSRNHFDCVIDSLKHIKGVDFNQGLNARRLRSWHIDRLKDLDKPMIRFAWDNINDEKAVVEAVNSIISAGMAKSRISIFVLFGFEDTPDDTLYRLVTTRDVLKVTPYPMRYQPLNALKMNAYVAPGWTDKQLHQYTRYWTRQRFLRQIPFADYK